MYSADVAYQIRERGPAATKDGIDGVGFEAYQIRERGPAATIEPSPYPTA